MPQQGAAALAVLLLLIGCVRASPDACDAVGPRADCGYPGIGQLNCERKGCCWAPSSFEGTPPGVDIDVATCFYPNTGASEYELANVADTGDVVNGTLLLSSAAQPELGPDVVQASLLIESAGDSVVRVRIRDATAPRWEVPLALFRSTLLQGEDPPLSGDRQFEVLYQEAPFGFAVLHSPTGRTVFNTTGLRLVFKDQYLELSTWVAPGATVFGAGERAGGGLPLLRNGFPYALWARDLPPTVPYRNSYSSHPFVLGLEEDGAAWGALLLNSNGMDIVATPDRLSWRALGGVVDLFVFVGPTPLAVLDQLTSVVGRPARMPWWALGWHQSTSGHGSIEELQSVLANYSAAGLALEALWSDASWLLGGAGPTAPPPQELQTFVEGVRASGQHLAATVDPSIPVASGTPAFDEGLQRGLFLQGVDGDPYLAAARAGPAYFPDFLSPESQAYFWAAVLQAGHNATGWSGISLDVNEASNYCTGDICHMPTPTAMLNQLGRPAWECPLLCYAQGEAGLSDAQLRLVAPPYQISNGLQRQPLNAQAISVLASHWEGVLEYDAHNLFGHAQALRTSEAARAATGQRPFVLSRSTFVGTGAFAAHWTGDNLSDWPDMAWSIAGIINSGLAGIPFAGADVCGFLGNATEELCNRWTALGAFYPFARSRADASSEPQEPYRWPAVAETTRTVLAMRYRLLPYLYTALHSASSTGAPLMRPLWMNFPQDAATHKNSRQFMLSDSVLVTPVLEPSVDSVEGYFPQGLWYSLWPVVELTEDSLVDASMEGRVANLSAPLGTIPVHVRGGAVLPMQQAALTTAAVKASPLVVVVALPGLVTEGSTAGGPLLALGDMYNDDGISAEAPTSCCNFLTMELLVEYDAVNDTHAATLELRFGRTPPQEGQLGQQQELCNATDPGLAWPALSAVEVLGWQRGAGAPRLEVLPPDSEEPELIAELEESEVVANGYSTLFNLSEPVPLECPRRIRLAWDSAGGAGGA